MNVILITMRFLVYFSLISGLSPPAGIYATATCVDNFIPDLLSCVKKLNMDLATTIEDFQSITLIPFGPETAKPGFVNTMFNISKCICTTKVLDDAILHDQTCLEAGSAGTSQYELLIRYLCLYEP
jgi:hypothetical protein